MAAPRLPHHTRGRGPRAGGYIYIYIYIYRERERERDRDLSLSLSLFMYIYIYIYIYNLEAMVWSILEADVAHYVVSYQFIRFPTIHIMQYDIRARLGIEPPLQKEL